MTTKTKHIQDWRARKFGFKAKPKGYGKDFIYELRKKQLPRSLTSEQYDEEIRKICLELGI